MSFKIFTYLPWPIPRFRFDVRLARLASRSPDTNFPAGPPGFPPGVTIPPLAGADVGNEFCGWRMSPKKLAPRPWREKNTLLNIIIQNSRQVKITRCTVVVVASKCAGERGVRCKACSRSWWGAVCSKPRAVIEYRSKRVSSQLIQNGNY